MPTVHRTPPVLLLLGAAVCAASAASPAAAQQYAVPAGEPIVLDGYDPVPPAPRPAAGATGGGAAGVGQPVYGEPVYGEPVYGEPVTGSVGGGSFGGEVYGGHAGSLSQTPYPSAAGGMEIVGGPHAATRSTRYPSAGFSQDAMIPGPYSGGSYGGEVYGGEVYGGGGYGAGGYGGGYVFDDPGCGGACGGPVCDSVCDRVCSDCGTNCAPGACDPTCEGDLACGGPVVCNKFGRCGKFYNTAVTRSRCGLSAGYAFLFLSPRQGDATAAVTRRPVAGGTFSRRQDFDYDLEAGSRIFVEMIRPDSMGVRLTYSGLEADSDRRTFASDGGVVTGAAVPAAFALDTNAPAGTLLATGGDVLTARGQVEFDTFDLEGTRRLRAGRWLLNTGGGVRFARLEQNYHARVLGAAPGAVFSETTFDGAGPTGFAEARRPIGNTGFALLSAARVSLLVGENSSKATLTQFGVTNRGDSDRTDFAPVGELQLGGEWSAWVNPNTLFFTQLAYEGQLWTGVGGPGSHEGNVGFTGFNLSFGLEW